MKKKFRTKLPSEEKDLRIEVMGQPSIKAKLVLAFKYFPELQECSHETISEFIGNARESVSRILSKMKGKQ